MKHFHIKHILVMKSVRIFTEVTVIFDYLQFLSNYIKFY